jgi:hypothetical protein
VIPEIRLVVCAIAADKAGPNDKGWLEVLFKSGVVV